MGTQPSYRIRYSDGYYACGESVDYIATLCPRCADADAKRVVGELVADTNYPRRARAALRLHVMTETVTTDTLHQLWRDYRYSDPSIAKAFEAMSDHYSWKSFDQFGSAEYCDECSNVIGYDYCACIACNVEGDISATSSYLESINSCSSSDELVAVICNDCAMGGDNADLLKSVTSAALWSAATEPTNHTMPYAEWVDRRLSARTWSEREHDARRDSFGVFLADMSRQLVASSHVGELFA